ERRDDGSWGKATNLGPPINTDADEVSPFIAADNMTLYFSSDGHPGLEGTDLYVTRLIRGQWQAPQNMGYPLNSAANDEFLTLAADGKTIYFASRRDGGEGGLDLYKAYPNPYPPQPVTVLSGKILEFGTREPLSMPIVIRDAETGTILRKQQSNAYTGEYILVLASGKTYSISTGEIPYLPDSLQLDLRVQERYDEQSYNFMLHREQPMQQLAVSVSANVLRSDFSLLEGAETVGGLTITEVQAGETIPLLNYVFFDHGSAQIPQRYVQLTKYTVVDYSIAALPDGALGKYHHVLNILGQRLQQQPELAVRLTGAVSEDEMQLGDLAGRRVQAVSQYLMDVWGIEAGRIEVTADGLPQNPSGSETPQGQAENRRVEILYRDGDNLEPINTTSMTRILKPAQCVFYPSIMSNAGVREWELAVAKEGSIQRIWRGQDSYPDSIVWNWQDAEGNVPRNESPLSFTLSATDIDGYSQTSQEHTIPVQFDSYTNTGSTSAGFVVDTFHLILFDFDQADVSRMNRQILDQVSERVTQQSRILIRGYSDEIGTAEYNRELAERRAEAVRQVLRVRHPNTPVVTEALGESELLYDNALPEGRFYCRTVRVIVETRR
ncbi:MAG: hypothetical protein CL946_02365, partial [Ectothiorhodospiraceae bacterium]|nr:hypothetical protein [Ectothiorhodospiraceae bacterium]